MTDGSSDYSSRTLRSPDSLRRYAHSTRFKLAASLAPFNGESRILDYGGGDGAFLEFLMAGKRPNVVPVLFEPYMQGTLWGGVRRFSAWSDLEAFASDRKFDLIFCLEVMEHLSAERQNEVMERITSVTSPAGRLVLSVPVEVGPVALLKNVGRWKYRREHPDVYTYTNLAKSLFGVQVPECRSGNGYLSHMGFYYWDLKRVLKKRFTIERTLGSPIASLPGLMNSQVFFVCRPKT
jgi:SAM-dependent methyltransferase